MRDDLKRKMLELEHRIAITESYDEWERKNAGVLAELVKIQDRCEHHETIDCGQAVFVILNEQIGGEYQTPVQCVDCKKFFNKSTK